MGKGEEQATAAQEQAAATLHQLLARLSDADCGEQILRWLTGFAGAPHLHAVAAVFARGCSEAAASRVASAAALTALKVLHVVATSTVTAGTTGSSNGSSAGKKPQPQSDPAACVFASLRSVGTPPNTGIQVRRERQRFAGRSAALALVGTPS